jgi:hypothetical protein
VSLLDHPSFIDTAPARLDELEDAFLAWIHDPVKPDVVALGPDRTVSMLTLSRHLKRSSATLAPAACTQLGLPADVTIATAATELLHATVDPDGPRCRSFRSASYYLRSLIRLDADRRPGSGDLARRTVSPRGHPDVR